MGLVKSRSNFDVDRLIAVFVLLHNCMRNRIRQRVFSLIPEMSDLDCVFTAYFFCHYYERVKLDCKTKITTTNTHEHNKVGGALFFGGDLDRAIFWKADSIRLFF